MTSKKLFTLAAAHVLLTATPALAMDQEHGHAAGDDAQQQQVAAAKATAKNAHTIQIAVTSEGFVPAEVTVKKGEKVSLVVTRKTDKTCATAFVMKEKGINVNLPLDKPVKVALKADREATSSLPALWV
jgi:plastocyanin